MQIPQLGTTIEYFASLTSAPLVGIVVSIVSAGSMVTTASVNLVVFNTDGTLLTPPVASVPYVTTRQELPSTGPFCIPLRK